MEPIKVAFIGGGPRANSLFSSIVFNKNNEEKVEPYAIMDLNQQVLDDWKFKVEHHCNTMDGHLKLDIDAVIIGTPPNTHYWQNQ